MKKTLILALVALMLLAAGASATITRVVTMGNTNSILLDEANIYLFPARINMYPNIAQAEVGRLADFGTDSYYDVANFGIHWKFGEKNPWVLGTYFYTSGQQRPGYVGLGLSNTMLPVDYPMPSLNSSFFDQNWLPYVTDNKRFTLFYGRKLGSNPFGFSLNYVQSSYKVDSVLYKQGTSEVDFGFGLTDANGKWDLGAGVNFMSWSWQNNAASIETKPAGNMSLWLNGRYFKTINPQWTIVPNGGLVIGKYEADFYNGGATSQGTEKINITAAFLGLGAHYTPAASVLAVGEVGVAFNSTKWTDTPTAGTAEEFKAHYFTLPYFKMGLEGKVFDWMDVRVGATSYWHRESYQTGTSAAKQKWNWPDNHTYLGTGLHFGNLHIDTWTDSDILLKGFYFISGRDSGNGIGDGDLNAHVSVLYEFK